MHFPVGKGTIFGVLLGKIAGFHGGHKLCETGSCCRNLHVFFWLWGPKSCCTKQENDEQK